MWKLPFSIIYYRIIAYYCLPAFVDTKNHFSQGQEMPTFSLTELSNRGQQVLPKKSTYVDQNLRSKSTHSQLSVAIFIASRIHLGAEKVH